MQVNLSSPAAAQIATQAGESQTTTRSGSATSSTISSSSESKGFFSTALDILTFIPRKIWWLIKMIFCCCQSGQLSLADQIKKDPEATAKKTIALLNDKGLDEGMKSTRKGLANLFFNPENQNEEMRAKLIRWTEVFAKEGNQAYKVAIEEACTHLRNCYSLPDTIAKQPQTAAAHAIAALEAIGYDEGKAYLMRGFATKDPKTPEGLQWTRENNKKFLQFVEELVKIVESWMPPTSGAAAAAYDPSVFTPIRKEIASNINADLMKIMQPYTDALQGKQQ